MKTRFLTIMIAVGLLTTSCSEDYLVTAPTGSVDAGAAYSTTKNASAAINGIYRAMVVRYLSSQGHFGHPAMMIIMDVMGDDLVLANESAARTFAAVTSGRSTGSTKRPSAPSSNATRVACANAALRSLGSASTSGIIPRAAASART